ncbi:hypothetical protein BDF19DRAFT_153916 [Syncephalis fuscata]|nr:hypothetical protein BDF19DRAFT_153916 [Syncephalis fuscata]
MDELRQPLKPLSIANSVPVTNNTATQEDNASHYATTNKITPPKRPATSEDCNENTDTNGVSLVSVKRARLSSEYQYSEQDMVIKDKGPLLFDDSCWPATSTKTMNSPSQFVQLSSTNTDHLSGSAQSPIVLDSPHPQGTSTTPPFTLNDTIESPLKCISNTSLSLLDTDLSTIPLFSSASPLRDTLVDIPIEPTIPIITTPIASTPIVISESSTPSTVVEMLSIHLIYLVKNKHLHRLIDYRR